MKKIIHLFIIIAIVVGTFSYSPAKTSAYVVCDISAANIDNTNKIARINWGYQADADFDYQNIDIDFGDGSPQAFVAKVNGTQQLFTGVINHTYSGFGPYYVELIHGSDCSRFVQVDFTPPTPATCTDTSADNYGGALPCTYTMVNLNFIVTETCASSPVSQASVNIDQDFGNGTSRTTDGGGFANFGAYKNRSVNYTVSKSGYGSASGNVNTGTNGATVNINFTPTAGCNSPSTPPSVSIGASPSSITSGGASTISWSSSNTTSCTVSPSGWTGTSGSQSTGAITSNTTYTISCTGPGGSTSGSATVTVTAAPSTYTISGYVYRDFNTTTCCTGVKNAGEPGISGRTVTLANSSTGAVISTANTNASGYYTIPNVSSGTYRISHPIPSGYVRTTDDSTLITVSGNTTYDFGLYMASPSTPTNLTATCNAAGDQVDLTWGASTGATNYLFRIDPAPVGVTANCGATGTTLCVDYYAGTSYTATVVPGQSYSSWVYGNNCTDYTQSASCLSAAASTSFTCSAPSPYSLTIIKTGRGTVSSTDNLINCGADCAEDYARNTGVTLTAVPASSYWKFTGWAGDCSGTGACVLIMSSPKLVQARFERRLFNYYEF